MDGAARLFPRQDDADSERLRSLLHSDGVDVNAVQRFLTLVLAPAAAAKVVDPQAQRDAAEGAVRDVASSPPFGIVDVDRLAEKLDMKETVMETLLSYLESHPTPSDDAEQDGVQGEAAGGGGWVQTIPSWFATVEVTFHEDAPEIAAAASQLAAAVVATAQQPVRGGRHVCSTAALAACVGAGVPAVLQAQLQQLAMGGKIRYELCDRGLAFVRRGAPPDATTLAALARQLAARLARAEACQAAKLDTMVAAASAALSVPGAALARLAAMTDPAAAAAAPPSLQDPELRRIISAYFEAATTVPAATAATADAAASASAAMPAKPPGAKAAFLRADIKVLMRSCAGVRLTARAAARILHGVGSPSFPATAWSRNPFWGRHAAVPFDDVKRMAHEELVANVC